jgi:hypothetical protein
MNKYNPQITQITRINYFYWLKANGLKAQGSRLEAK